MHDQPDHELLRNYALQGSEEAFTELVRRHCDLVWAAARRVSGNADAAHDVAQMVFTDLARKAGRLPVGTVLAGWLYRAACHAAANQVRGEIRRTQREQQAMQQDHYPSAITEDGETRVVADLQPVLDAALGQLSEADRDAVVLRYLSGRSLAEVGATLGTSEDAAQKRVSRALEKLREIFRQRGVTVSGGTLAIALGVAGTQTAPVGLAATLAGGALVGVGAPTGAAAWFLLMKSKLVLGIVAGALVFTTMVQQQRNVRRLADDNATLRRQMAEMAAPATVATAGNDLGELERLRGEHAELLQLRGELTQLRQAARQPKARPSAAPVARAGDMDAQTLEILKAEANSTRIVNAMKHLGQAAYRFASGNGSKFPTTLEEMRGELPLSADGTLPNNVPPDLFEFFHRDRPLDATEPERILFREKTARQLPGGHWERIYTLADGSVHRITRADGDFTEFESGR